MLLKKLIERIKNSIYYSEPTQQDIVGIDISHGYVRAIQLTKIQSQWSLTKLATKTINRSNQDQATVEKEILRLLKNIKLEQKFDTNNAAISLPVNSAIVQVIQIPYLDDVELNVAVENGSLWESSINIPGDLSEYSIFWQVVKRNQEKNELSILFVASRIDEIERYCDLVRQAGFDPLIIDVRCFALRNILKTYIDSEASKLVVFLEISGEENYIVFVYDNLPFIYDIFVMDLDADALSEGGELLTPDVFRRIGSQIRSSVGSFIKQSGAPGIEKINFISSLPNLDLIFNGLKHEIVEFKLEAFNPLSQIQVPAHLASRVESEKNISSLTVAAGLATRRLDIFGYFKFVTAVANINLLPNRQEIIKQEEDKVTTSSKISKVALFTTALMLLFIVTYNYLLLSFPSKAEIDALQSKSLLVEAEVAKLRTGYVSYRHWVDQINKQNEKVLNISFLQQLPNGLYVTDMTQKRKDLSEISVKAADPVLVSQSINLMSKQFKNVKLLAVEANQEDLYQLSKITYRVE